MYAWLHSFSKSRQSCIMLYAPDRSSSVRSPAASISASVMPNSSLSVICASSQGVVIRTRSRFAGASTARARTEARRAGALLEVRRAGMDARPASGTAEAMAEAIVVCVRVPARKGSSGGCARRGERSAPARSDRDEASIAERSAMRKPEGHPIYPSRKSARGEGGGSRPRAGRAVAPRARRRSSIADHAPEVATLSRTSFARVKSEPRRVRLPRTTHRLAFFGREEVETILRLPSIATFGRGLACFVRCSYQCLFSVNYAHVKV